MIVISVDTEDIALVNVNLTLIVHITIIVTCFFLITWVALRYALFLGSGSNKTREQNKDENEIEDYNFGEDNIFPDWLQNRKEMIFKRNRVNRKRETGGAKIRGFIYFYCTISYLISIFLFNLFGRDEATLYEAVILFWWPTS